MLCKLYLLADIDYPFSTPLSDKVVLALGVAIVAVNLCALISYICVFFKTAFKSQRCEGNRYENNKNEKNAKRACYIGKNVLK